MITIFTPTYNRKHLLPRLYKSLCGQTNKNFEWVVDDGSTDGTPYLFEKWIPNASFNIKCISVENGGKHRAINRGVKEAEGELFFIVDSDDYLREDAVQKIFEWTADIDESFAGVAGLRVYSDGKMIGTSFSESDFLDATALEKKKFNITGDKSEVFFTNILREFPFPEIDGEKFAPEDLVWNRIAAKGYKIRWYNEGIYYCDYQEDGLSARIDKLLTDNFKSYAMYCKELLAAKDMTAAEKYSCMSNYARRARINGYSYSKISKDLNVNIITVLGLKMVVDIVYKKRAARR